MSRAKPTKKSRANRTRAKQSAPPKSGVGGKRKGAGRPRRVARIQDFEQLGAAPLDELEAARWAFRANAVALREVMIDKSLAPERRRSEIRTLSRAMNALLPKARLAEAERLLRASAERIAAPKAGPSLEPVPRPTNHKATDDGGM